MGRGPSQAPLELLDIAASAGAGAAGTGLLQEQMSQPSAPFLKPCSQNILHEIVTFLLQSTADTAGGSLHEQMSQPSEPFLKPCSQKILHDIVIFVLQSTAAGESLHEHVSQPSAPFLNPNSQNIAQAGLLSQRFGTLRLL